MRFAHPVSNCTALRAVVSTDQSANLVRSTGISSTAKAVGRPTSLESSARLSALTREQRTRHAGTHCTALVPSTEKALPRRPISSPGGSRPRAIAASASGSSGAASPGKAVLLFDVMDTLVYDPFFEHVPALFSLSLEELFAAKDPEAWLDFERGLLSEQQLAEQYFTDRRAVDIEAVKTCLRERYAWLEGMEWLLARLVNAEYDVHAFSNYPAWFSIIEDKLELSRYLRWSAVSCEMQVRKPEAAAFEQAAAAAGVEVQQCVFVDDSLTNVEAARAAGMRALHFRGCAETLEIELNSLGITF